MVRRPMTLVAATLTAMFLAPGCSDPVETVGSSVATAGVATTAAVTTATATAAATAATTVPPIVPTDDTTAVTPSPASSDPPSSAAVAPATDPVPISDPPQTGLPGAAASAFCRAYATLVVTDHLVGLVEAFGDEAGARRAEVVAAPSFLAAFEMAIGAFLEVGPTDDPFAERWSGAAERARIAVESGVRREDVVDAWERVLATHDRNDPVLVLDLPPLVSAAVDTAAAALGAARGSLASDEVYRTRSLLATPDVDRYVAERCPEVADVATGDAV